MQPYRHILWNIVNVLSSYILVVRRYIGEHHNDLTAAESVINLSSNLKSDQNFESKEAAVESVIHCAKTVGTSLELVIINFDFTKTTTLNTTSN